MVKDGDLVLAKKDYLGMVQGYAYTIQYVTTSGFRIDLTNNVSLGFFHNEFNQYFESLTLEEPAKESFVLHKPTDKKCICGEASLKGSRHSSWCEVV